MLADHGRRARAALVLVLLATVTAPAASGTYAAACEGTWFWYFDNGLGLAPTRGTVYVSSDLTHNQCAGIETPCPGAQACAGQVVAWEGKFSAPYEGDCLDATVHMPGGWIRILDGTVVVGLWGTGSSWHLAGALGNACLLNGAHGQFHVAEVS